MDAGKRWLKMSLERQQQRSQLSFFFSFSFVAHRWDYHENSKEKIIAKLGVDAKLSNEPPQNCEANAAPFHMRKPKVLHT